MLPLDAPTERRARFSREVEILGGLEVRGIPRLIDSNVSHSGDSSYELFLAAEFIDGRRMNNVASAGITALAAVDLTIKIVRIVKSAHAVDVVHRDIKPDNVVIREEPGVLTPFLVDFGMAYIEDNPVGFATKKGQEVGNRFLRLPEYHSGFGNKSDPRSDLTFCVGLLFYMLTKTNPTVLRDENDYPPHLRRFERIALRESGLDEDRLLRFFDAGFQYDIGKRFQTANELIAGLEGLLQPIAALAVDANALAAKLSDRFMTPTLLARQAAVAAARARVREIAITLQHISEEFGGVLVISQASARDVTGGSSSEYSLTDPTNYLKRYDVTAAVENIGSEQILSLTDGNGLRTEARLATGTRPSDDQFSRIRAFLLSGIFHATSDERFFSPRELKPSSHYPGIYLGPGLQLPEEEATFEFRPVLKIAWFLPRLVDGNLTIAWELTNIGSGTACDVCVFLPNVACYREADMPVGSTRQNERRYDRVAAYHSFTNPPVHIITGCADERGNVYRQSGDVVAFPAYRGGTADYLTTQLGYPYLVTDHGIRPDDAVDRFHQTEPHNWVNIPEV